MVEVSTTSGKTSAWCRKPICYDELKDIDIYGWFHVWQHVKLSDALSWGPSTT